MRGARRAAVTALAGFWSFGPAGARAAAARILAAQAIYGADPRHWHGDGIGLGRRLFRTLPEDAFDHGPVVGASGCVLIADVRLDNRAELAERGGIDAGALRALSDAALLMRLWEREGEAAIARLVGDFALALWDPRLRRLTLARDYLGQRPLHYHRGRAFVAVASMPKGLHSLPDIPYEIDEARLADLMAILPETGSGTVFAGIEKVAPGQIVTITAEGTRARCYWRPDGATLRLGKPGDYAEALRARFDEAVASRLRGVDGAVAAHLSAGLDSATVVATAARIAPDMRVVAFTAAPGAHDPLAGFDAIPDEGPLAAAVARRFANIEHVLLRAGAVSPLAGLDRNVFVYDRPMPNLSNAVWLDAINDAARDRGLRILLTGQAGNLGFSWTGDTALAELIAQARLAAFVANAAALARNGTKLRSILRQAAAPLMPGWAWRRFRMLRGKGGGFQAYSPISRDAEARLDLRARAAAGGVDLSYQPILDHRARRIAALRRVDPGNYNKGTIGGWGIDLRDPTADRRLIELCLAIPSELYLQGGRPRGLARTAFADRLPPEVAGEARKGFQAADWHVGFAAARDAAVAEVERIAASPAAALLDIERMRALAAAPPPANCNDDGTIRAYRAVLLRGISMGHFVRKVHGGNA